MTSPRLIYALLIYLFCFVVAGCGGGSESSSDSSNSGSSDNSTIISGLALSGGALSEADITLSQLSESGPSDIGNKIKKILNSKSKSIRGRIRYFEKA
mgnify:CR=1 FL=1